MTNGAMSFSMGIWERTGNDNRDRIKYKSKSHDFVVIFYI